jgi:hypothetical protein
MSDEWIRSNVEVCSLTVLQNHLKAAAFEGKLSAHRCEPRLTRLQTRADDLRATGSRTLFACSPASSHTRLRGSRSVRKVELGPCFLGTFMRRGGDEQRRGVREGQSLRQCRAVAVGRGRGTEEDCPALHGRPLRVRLPDPLGSFRQTNMSRRRLLIADSRHRAFATYSASMSRAFFWPLISLGSVLFALASGCLATAVFSDPLPPGSVEYEPYGYTEMFGRATSLSWSTDRGFLLAAIGFAIAACLVYAAARQSRGAS